MGLKSKFKAEVKEELIKYSDASKEVFTDNEIKQLPEPVQRYFRYCGYTGKEKMVNAQMIWQNAFIRTAPEKEWMKLDCLQFNSVPEPCRIVYMKNNINGLIPFEGRDKMQNGHGNMLIKLAKFITITDDKSAEMDKSALVTNLSEALLLPSYAVQDYIRWEEIDKNSALATLTHNNISVKGKFLFNDIGENIRFDSDDRYRSERGQYKPVKWSVLISGYIEKTGIKFPTEFSAVWIGEKSEFEYYRCKLKEINYNIKELIL